MFGVNTIYPTAESLCLELIQSIQTAESCFIRHVSVLLTPVLSWQETSLLKIGQESFVPALKRCSPEDGKGKEREQRKSILTCRLPLTLPCR